MIRNLKALGLAGLTMLALTALAAPAAHAEAIFTVPGASKNAQTTLTLLKDGTGKTAHWVFDISNAAGTEGLSLTCEEARANEMEHDGLATGPEFADFTIVTPLFSKCEANGNTFTAKNEGCSFTYTSGGELDIVPAAKHLCEPKREAFVFSNATLPCTIEIGKQTLTGVGYHTVEEKEGGQTVLTVELNSVKFSYAATGAGCPYGETSNGTITTGNHIITGEQAFGGAMVSFSWHV